MRARRQLENTAPAFIKTPYFRDDRVRRDSEGAPGRKAEPRGAEGKFFKLAATLTAASYALVFLCSLLWSFYALSGSGLDITWNVGSNPKTFIAMTLAAGAAFLWLLKNPLGKVLSLASFSFVLWQFYAWYETTSQLKTNTGMSLLPRAGAVGNIWYGAGLVELLLLLAVAVLFCVNLYQLLCEAGHVITRLWPRRVAPDGHDLHHANGHYSRRRA